MSSGSETRKCDVAIVGAGVLGVTIAYWLSQLYSCSIVILDQAPRAAFHASTRNTGVIHRPFYLEPGKKRTFAVSALLSYPLWHEIANRFGHPWNQVGTLEVATRNEDLRTLEKYAAWGIENGMKESELRLLDGGSAQALEPEVRCLGAIHSSEDASVDFGGMTRSVLLTAGENGVEFLPGQKVESILIRREGLISVGLVDDSKRMKLACNYLINAAGGGSIDIAHMFGLATEYTDLHFRGDYWLVDTSFGSRVRGNVYSVPRHSEFPFLDPHFVVRADASRQIGPNAALVSDPYAYSGIGGGVLAKITERPIVPKAKLFVNESFLSMAWEEWTSSLSRNAMCSRMNRFIPNLRPSHIGRRGLAGVRSSVIDRSGFVPEAIRIEGENSFHILNYNSPGATGAPVFAALVAQRLSSSGALDGPVRSPRSHHPLWNFYDVVESLDREGVGGTSKVAS